MKIGVLAYGSLIADPGAELAAITVERRAPVETPFRVEFARSSKGRAGAPTLVPVDAGGTSVQGHLLTVDAKLKDVIDIVYRREINRVGSTFEYRVRGVRSVDAVHIEKFRDFEGHDAVIYARLLANILPLTASVLADLAIASARALSDGRDGISYLIATLAAGTSTPLANQYAAEILRKTGMPNLDAALESVRKIEP